MIKINLFDPIKKSIYGTATFGDIIYVLMIALGFSFLTIISFIILAIIVSKFSNY